MTAIKKPSAANASSSAVFSFGDAISIFYLMTGGVTNE